MTSLAVSVSREEEAVSVVGIVPDIPRRVPPLDSESLLVAKATDFDSFSSSSLRVYWWFSHNCFCNFYYLLIELCIP